MFGRLTLFLDKQQIHGEQKFREVSIVQLSYAIRVQFQHEPPWAIRVISHDHYPNNPPPHNTVFTRIIHYLRMQSYLHDQRQNRLRRTSVSLTRSSVSVPSVLDLANWYSQFKLNLEGAEAGIGGDSLPYGDSGLYE